MNEKDIKIVQDTKILQQILKTIPENMHNQINIVMVNEVHQGTEELDFWNFLQALPEPRMAKLKELAVQTTMKFHNGNKLRTAKFLGITGRTMYPTKLHQDMAKELD